MENLDFTKGWVLLRQLLLGLSGAGVISWLVPPDQLASVIAAIDKLVPLLGEAASLVVFVGTVVYGLFFSRPAKAAEAVKGEKL
jgi:hypothetical protein